MKKIIPVSQVILLGLIILGLGSAPFTVPKKAGLAFGDLGKWMGEMGVIDQDKFLALYQNNPELEKQAKILLSGKNSDKLDITSENAGLFLNFLWAFGLGNKNEILEKGEMADPRYGGADRFASTGGWTLSRGNAMAHYSMHEFVILSPEEQELVDKVSREIYRPCCQNSAHFPDCNHGMAMLGYLELLAKQGASAEEMKEKANVLNSLWFPGWGGGSCAV